MKEKAKSEELTAKEKQELEIEKKRKLEIEEKQILKSVELKYDQKKREEQNRDESGLSDEGKWYWAVKKMSNSLVWREGYIQKEKSSPRESHDALFDILEKLLKDSDLSNGNDRFEISHRLIESINLFRRKNGIQSYVFPEGFIKDSVVVEKSSEELNKFISGEDKLHIAFINQVIKKYEVPSEAWKILKTLAIKSNKENIPIDVEGYRPVYMRLNLQDPTNNLLYQDTPFESRDHGINLSKKAFNTYWYRKKKQ